MGRPREHTEGTAAALLEAAEQLVTTHGPAGVSVRSVADAAGTSTRAVYALFGSKAGLVDALAARLFRLLSQAVDAVPRTSDPVADVVTASVDGFRRVVVDHPSLYRLVFLDAEAEPVVGGVRMVEAAAAFGRLEALLGGVEAAHGLQGRSAREAARAVHALTEGLAVIDLRGELGPGTEAREVWRTAVLALVRGLCGPARPPR